jgi:hypothetical protein
VLFFCLLCGLVNAANAQEGGGIVAGHVADQSGAMVRDADVTISSAERKTSITLKTNGDGS